MAIKKKPAAKPVVHKEPEVHVPSLVNYVEENKPAPVTSGPKCKYCGHHGQQWHYGNVRRWCNHPGCDCQGIE